MENNGPTLNPVYNDTLLDGIYKPQCEKCGCDLTGKQVVPAPLQMKPIDWICELCEDDWKESSLNAKQQD
jgi:hypothetical protein